MVPFCSYAPAGVELKAIIFLLDKKGDAGSGAGNFRYLSKWQMGACAGVFWGAALTRWDFGACFGCGKRGALSQGVHSKADESIGLFLCEHYAEEDEAIGGLAAFN